MTIESNQDEFLWVQKYRPMSVDQCILPSATKQQIKDIISKGEIPNLLFSGGPGTGKTTLASAIANELGSDLMFINASLENGIDVLRSKIQGFASSVSFSDGPKIVLLDEADYTNPQSFQPALRGFIETFSNNCRFILTCNYKNKLIEPLHSRFINIDFKIDNKEKALLQGQFFKRAIEILTKEGIEFDKKVVSELIIKNFPDYRSILNELQRYSVSGKIDSGIFVNLSKDVYKELFTALKDKDYTAVRKWVSTHSDGDSVAVFRELFDQSNGMIEPTTIPSLVLILADYDYKSSFVSDHELNLLAALIEIMSSCKFK